MLSRAVAPAAAMKCLRFIGCSYGGRLSVSPWLRLYAAQASATLQACPAVVSQQARSIGFRLFHQAMPAISSAVGRRWRSGRLTDTGPVPPVHVVATA